MVSKLIEKSSLGSDFLEFLSSHPKLTVLDRCRIVLAHILKSNILSTKCCDEAMPEFKLFLHDNAIKFKEKLMEFPKYERLDELYVNTLGVFRFKKLT